jgi:hypothetical protein
VQSNPRLLGPNWPTQIEKIQTMSFGGEWYGTCYSWWTSLKEMLFAGIEVNEAADQQRGYNFWVLQYSQARNTKAQQVNKGRCYGQCSINSFLRTYSPLIINRRINRVGWCPGQAE